MTYPEDGYKVGRVQPSGLTERIFETLDLMRSDQIRAFTANIVVAVHYETLQVSVTSKPLLGRCGLQQKFYWHAEHIDKSGRPEGRYHLPGCLLGAQFQTSWYGKEPAENKLKGIC